MQLNIQQKPDRPILGLLKPLDFAIHLSTKNSLYEAFIKDDPAARLNFFHKWTHYLQFISTAIGRKISYARHVATIERLRYLASCPKPVRLPLANRIEEQKPVKAQKDIFEQLELMEFNCSNFHVDWDKPVRKIIDAYRLHPLLDQEYLKKNKPISLDLEQGAFIFRLPDGEAVQFQVSPHQICEFMASAVELDLANRLHYRWLNSSYMKSYFALENPANLEHTLPLLYLNQFTSIEPVQFNPAYNPLLTGLIIACYLSLYMDEDSVIRAGKKEGVNIDEAGPDKYPGIFLVRLLNCLINDINIEADTDFINGNWKQLYDKLCHLINWPSFSSIYKLARKSIATDITTLGYRLPGFKVSTEESANDEGISSILVPVLIKEYRESLKTFATIRDIPDMIAFPYMLFHQRRVSLPVICYSDDNNQLITYPDNKNLQKLKGSSRPILDTESAFTLWACRHSLDKIWYGRDLGCFWVEEGKRFYDSVHYCKYSTREECAARQNGLKKTAEYNKEQPPHLAHCINPEWKESVTRLLAVCGLTLEDIL